MLTFYNNKALRHLDRLMPYSQGFPIIPVTLDIDLTNACNCKCPGCAGGRGTANEMLETSLVQNLMREAASLGVKSVVFTGGGESTLHPELPHLLDCAKQYGLSTALVTNAIMFDSNLHLAEAVVRHCTWVRCSLDASDAAMYRETHGMDGFQKALGGIANLIDQRRIMGNGPTIGVAYLTGPATIHGVWDACLAVESLGADYIYFRPFLGDKTPIDLDGLRREFNTETFEVIGAIAYSLFHARQRPYSTCGFGWWVSVVKADGQVTWCCHTRDQQGKHLGNLHNESLAAVLERRDDNIVDWSLCPMFCRGDQLNRFLEDMKKPLMHENFL